jgi:hypothetical protein
VFPILPKAVGQTSCSEKLTNMIDSRFMILVLLPFMSFLNMLEK